MKAGYVILIACIVAVVFADPPRPVLKEQFETQFTVHLTDPAHNQTIFGNGWWAVDTPKGHTSERIQYNAEHRHRNIHIIARYDNKTQYTITHQQGQGDKCSHVDLTHPISDTWAWLKEAKYSGKKKIADRTYDTWSYDLAETASILLAVNETHPNHPAWFEQKHNDEHMELHFHRYEERVPHPREFDVPQVCLKAE